MPKETFVGRDDVKLQVRWNKSKPGVQVGIEYPYQDFYFAEGDGPYNSLWIDLDPFSTWRLAKVVLRAARKVNKG